MSASATYSSATSERIANVARCQAVAALHAADADEDFARITRLAASLFDTPGAAITLVSATESRLISAIGTRQRSIPVADAISAHCIGSDEPVLFVPDACLDPRFRANPLVGGRPNIRFYAGAAITVRGQRVGVLQVFSPAPRTELSDSARGQLIELAGTAAALLELKDEARVRARTAAELIKEEWRHALTLEAGHVGSWVWDIPTDEIVANEILRRMFGLSQDAVVVGRDIFTAMDARDRPAVDEALRAAFEEGIDYHAEFRIAGSDRWLVGRGRVYQRDADGRPLIMMGVNIDVSDAHKASERTRQLLRELNHRVKNTLAMIQSLARQSMNGSRDPERFIESFSGRLQTLSEAHGLLSDRDWSGIWLDELVRGQVAPYATATPQIAIKGEDVYLPPDHALGLGIVLNELASNAAMHGALSVPEGRATISWTIEGASPRRLNLRWTESGGPPVSANARPGSGTRLIRHGLNKVIDSNVELELLPSGAEARISLPVD